MAETVAALAGATVTAPANDAYTRPVAAATPSEMDKDTFLKLLVAQLKYQDPMNPSSSEDFIATTAQFTTIEKLDEIAKQGANTALVNSLSMASALIGRTISVTRGGETFEAVVERSHIRSGDVVLVTDKGPVGFGEVTGVGATVGPAPTPKPPTQPRQPTEPSHDPVTDPISDTDQATATPTDAAPAEPPASDPTDDEEPTQ
ncbi:MAG: flagellar hook capping FlgD N-terminal domain-containing protein [Acidimicrobiales bacterium]